MTRRLALAAGLTLAAAAAAQGPPRPPADADATARLEQFMTERAAAGFSGVVLVARGGTILLQRGYGHLDAAKTMPVGADAVFTTGSITKQFTAAAVLRLEMEGRLSTDDPMATYLPGVPDDKRGITLHQLLTHTAGFPGASGDDLEPIGRDAFLARVLARPLAQPPGRFLYSNVGYSLLAAIVEIASGRGYEDYLADRLFRPAGMRDTGYARPRWAPERLARAIGDDGQDRGTFGEVAMPNGTPGWHLLGNGGILSTVGDMYRWHLALTRDTVLPAEAKAKMFRPWVDEGGGSHYGYGWSIEETPFGRLVTHNGGNRYFFSDLLRYVDRDLVIYFSTNTRDRAMRRLARPLAQIAMTGAVLDRPARSFTAVTAADAPAPAGSAAARWRLRGGPAAAAAARLLDAMAETNERTLAALVAEVFAPSLRERRSDA
ncbi:MAG: serine hydrolase domain-containing protein, partial [Acidobacteriota bacterium]